jgi:hypothetical protein
MIYYLSKKDYQRGSKVPKNILGLALKNAYIRRDLSMARLDFFCSNAVLSDQPDSSVVIKAIHNVGNLELVNMFMVRELGFNESGSV